MKKYISVLGTLALTFSLVGCRDDGEDCTPLYEFLGVCTSDVSGSGSSGGSGGGSNAGDSGGSGGGSNAGNSGGSGGGSNAGDSGGSGGSAPALMQSGDDSSDDTTGCTSYCNSNDPECYDISKCEDSKYDR